MKDRVLLSSVTMAASGGGVAGVARLMRDALRQAPQWHLREVALVADDEPVDRAMRAGHRARFIRRMVVNQVVWRPTLVVFNHLGPSRVQAFLPGSVRRPHVVFLHGIEAWTPLGEGERRALEGAQLVMANSHYTAMRARTANPWLPPVFVCPLAVPPSGAAADATRPTPAGDGLPASIPSDSLIVLMVGRMASAERYKGHDEVLDVWARIAQAVPAAHLVMVGDGDDRSRFVRRVAEAGLSASVTFTGFVDAATRDAIYRHAAVFLMPSRNEGFGLVYLEAMQYGVPCIGSIHDAAAEVIRHGETGMLVDQDDRQALMDAVVQLLQQPSVRRQQGEAARAYVAGPASVDAFRDRFLSLLSQARLRSAVRGDA